MYWITLIGSSNLPINYAGSLIVTVSDIPSQFLSQIFISVSNRQFIRNKASGIWTSWIELAPKGDLNSIIISKTYANIKTDTVGQIVLSDVPSGYRTISAVTENYRYGCFVSGSHSIRFYVIVDYGSPVRADNETVGNLTVTFAQNL